MPDPVLPGPVVGWPPAFSPAFVEQAKGLLDARPVLVIVGQVGGSRNRLAAEVAGAPDGPLWSRHVARFGEKDTPYFAIRQLISSLRVEEHDEPDVVEAAARRSLSALEEARPTFILANTDLCDPQSIEVLVRLAESGAIRVVATLTPETADEQTRLLGAGEVIDIPPLAHDTVGHLLHARFGAEPHPSLVKALIDRTGGSYGALRDIADASFDSGAIRLVDGLLVLDPEDPETARDRLHGLLAPSAAKRLGGGEAITTLLQVTSLLGQLDVVEARTHLGREAVDLAVAHGALTVADGALVFASRAEATVTMRTLPQPRLVELFERYADDLPHTFARPGVAVPAADWWRAVGTPLPTDLATHAAREANLTGRYRRAVVFTDPSNNEHLVPVAPIERSYALIELGETRELGEMFATIDPDTLTEDELLPYLRWVSRLSDGQHRDLVMTRIVDGAEPPVARRRAAIRSLAALIDQAFDEGGDDVFNQLRTLTFSAHLSRRNRAMAFAMLSCALRHSGRPVQAVESAEFALELLDAEIETVSAFHLEAARELHVVALMSAADLAGAEQAIARYSSGVMAQSGTGRMSTALRGFLSLYRGDLQQALADARVCMATLRHHDPHQMRGWTEALLAQILVRLGRTEEARATLESSTHHPANRRQFDLERRVTQAHVHDALAEPEEALDLLTGVVDEAGKHGLGLVEIEAAALSLQIGGPPYLARLLAAVDHLVDPTGSPAVWQRFAWAARDYDLPTLVTLADELSDAGSRLVAATVAQYVLDLARRSTDLDPDTRAWLEQLSDPMSDAGPRPRS